MCIRDRDEAHRFAGRLRKKVTTKRQTRWTLETIPGIGPARRKQLMAAFGTLGAIEKASIEEMLEKGISEHIAKAVYDHFHGDET